MDEDKRRLDDSSLLAIHGERLIRREIDQLLGICEFTLQDGLIDAHEAAEIYTWLNNHRACLNTWPASVLYARLRSMLADGVLDDDEQGDLLGLVASIVTPPVENKARAPSSLPVDSPVPDIVFDERSFCFTGVFDFGTRTDCHSAIRIRGGVPAERITQKLHYLVIGNVGAETWRHSSFGAKIAKAVEYREQGAPLKIVAETHWSNALK